MFDLPKDSILYADGSRGIYIPQYFAESVNRYTIARLSSWIVDLDELCKGPEECKYYWEIWDDVLNRMELTDPETGITYNLYQDGDLWLVPVGAELEEEE